MKLTKLIALSALLPSLCFAQAVGTGKGGSWALVLGERKIGDIFAKSPDPKTELPLSDDTKEYLSQLYELMTRYGIESSAFRELLVGNTSEYRLVDPGKLPHPDVFELADGTPAIQFGYTANAVTFLDPAEFFAAPVESQMFGLLHERLHAFFPNITPETHFLITDFVKGLYRIVMIIKEQSKTPNRKITTEERDLILNMIRRARQLGFNESEYRITDYGGAIYESDDKECIIGAGSRVQRTNLRRATILNSTVDKAKVQDSVISSSKVDGSIIMMSKLADANARFGSVVESEVSESEVSGTISKSKVLKKSSVRMGARITSTTLDSCTVYGEFSDTSCKDSFLNGGSYNNANFFNTTLRNKTCCGDLVLEFKDVTIQSLNIMIESAGGQSRWIFTGGYQDWSKFGEWSAMAVAGFPFNTDFFTKKVVITDPEAFYNQYHVSPK